MIRMMMAAAGVSIGLLVMPVATAPAKADINIDIDLGGKKRISCNTGRRIVEDSGYWNVRTRSCSGRYFDYYGTRDYYKKYVITVDSYKARIVNRRRIN